MSQREYTQFHSAAQNGDLPVVAGLIANGEDPNHFDDGGFTPLHYAAAEGHLEVVKALLAAGANVNAHDDAVIGNTPIAHIAGNCSLEMAKLLVSAGADPTIPGWMQLAALDQAEKRKRGDGPKVYQLLCEAASKRGKRS